MILQETSLIMVLSNDYRKRLYFSNNAPEQAFNCYACFRRLTMLTMGCLVKRRKVWNPVAKPTRWWQMTIIHIGELLMETADSQ